ASDRLSIACEIRDYIATEARPQMQHRGNIDMLAARRQDLQGGALRADEQVFDLAEGVPRGQLLILSRHTDMQPGFPIPILGTGDEDSERAMAGIDAVIVPVPAIGGGVLLPAGREHLGKPGG